MRGTRRIAVLVLLMLLPRHRTAAAADRFVVPYPVAEAAALFSRWLSENGGRPAVAREADGSVRITGEKGAAAWTIILFPDSPLATHVVATRSARDGNGAAREADARAAAAAYAADSAPAAREEAARVPPEVQARRDAVVCLRAKVPSGGEVQFSGFAVDRDGLILSTAHDLDAVRDVVVALPDGRERTGRTIRRDPGRDLMLVDAGLPLPAAVALARGRNLLEAGEPIFAVGCPDNRPLSVTAGIAEGTIRKVSGRPLWPVEMTTHPGSSGSPVFDVRGNLVGVVKGRFRGTETHGFVIPVETVLDFLKRGDAP